MSQRALTYVEIDVDFCSLSYGVAPCTAGAENWFFQNSNEGWTATNGTLTVGADASVFAGTAADPQLISPAALTIDGAANPVIMIDVERLSAGTFDGKVFYAVSGGHGFSASFVKQLDSNDFQIGVRKKIVVDMSLLTVGGDDWITNVITQIRFDFDATSGSSFKIYAVQVRPLNKCFNTLATTQDRPNFTNVPVTLRFAISTDYLPNDIEAIPSIRSANISPGTVSLGENLGERASLTVSFEDHRWSDTGQGFDKYLDERPYDPFKQGTFWGKFRARQLFLRGRPIRLIRGFLGQTLGEMETRHYVIDSFDGPTPDGGIYKLVGKDVLKLADGDRSKAPKLSNGFLVAAITDVATSATLSPAGIGNSEYPASGAAAIGGKEIVEFTRVADVLTLTLRGQRGTVAQGHSAQDRVQVALEYTAQDPADIISDLLQTYAGVPASNIPIASWKNETQNFYARLLTATIADPTDVDKLVSEIVEQAALAIWWSDQTQQIRLQVLRAISTEVARFTPETFLVGSLGSREQPDRRLSQVWTYYAQRNPLEGQTDPDNYRSTEATVELQAETDYGTPVIKRIFSRWIPLGGRTIATRLNDIQIARFRDPPRRFTFAILRGAAMIDLGAGYRLEGWPLQDDTGAAANVPIQVTRLNPKADVIEAEAQEMLFQAFEVTTGRTIIIDVNQNNLNLRTIHDTLFPTPVNGDSVLCIVEAGVVVGSTLTANPAFDIGAWPAGVTITLEVAGRIQGTGGAAGDGGNSSNDGDAGLVGGASLHTRYAIDLEVASGEIFGGGGGGGGGAGGFGFPNNGGGGGGGGGSGTQAGTFGTGGNGASSSHDGDDGTVGSADAGGSGGSRGLSDAGNGGDGGGPGLSGSNGGDGDGGTGGTGGSAGAAIDGVSFVTVTVGPGDIRGPQIN